MASFDEALAPTPASGGVSFGPAMTMRSSGNGASSDTITQAGMTVLQYTAVSGTLTIGAADTSYILNPTTATEGAITGTLTDNNDLSWTVGKTGRYYGIIQISGGASTAKRWCLGIAKNGTDIADHFGMGNSVTSNRHQMMFAYSLDLTTGDTVAPFVQNWTDSGNFTYWSAQHYIWSNA